MSVDAFLFFKRCSQSTCFSADVEATPPPDWLEEDEALCSAPLSSETRDVRCRDSLKLIGIIDHFDPAVLRIFP